MNRLSDLGRYFDDIRIVKLATTWQVVAYTSKNEKTVSSGTTIENAVQALLDFTISSKKQLL